MEEQARLFQEQAKQVTQFRTQVAAEEQVQQDEVVKTADIEKEKGNQTLTVEAVTSKPELDSMKQRTKQTQE